jgi:hypothetical protein
LPTRIFLRVLPDNKKNPESVNSPFTILQTSFQKGPSHKETKKGSLHPSFPIIKMDSKRKKKSY